MMRSVLVIFLVCCVVFYCLACYDEVRVGHLFSLLCCILLSACYDEVRVGHLAFVLLAMMRSVLVIFLVCCVVFFCPACYDEVRVGHLFSFLSCLL